MQQLPIHLFTIVLNGEPFIRYHIEMLQRLQIPWHWHIIEGVAELKHDTSWSLENGGKLPAHLHHEGRSRDGTSQYLDELQAQYPENISLYRKPPGEFWDGKREMVNAPLSTISSEVLLLQVDSDELWTAEQLTTLHEMFCNNPEKSAAWFWCWYFVGPELILSSRNCYAANPSYEWHRAWRFTPGSRWIAHEPPILQNSLGEDLGRKNPFSHFETEEAGLVFQHYSYVTEEQLLFKEQYYGYEDALKKWKELQEQNTFPVLLRDYFPWVKDSAVVEPVERFPLTPLAKRESSGWRFGNSVALPAAQSSKGESTVIEITTSQCPSIVIDGVYFAEEHRGIARVWQTLLEEWSQGPLRDQIVLLDRDRTAPSISGIRKRDIPGYDASDPLSDRALLESICQQEQAALFCSTYYTTPLSTPSVLHLYDMIPEHLGWNLNEPHWRQKRDAIEYASQIICISENTKADLHRFYPKIPPSQVIAVPIAYDQDRFTPASVKELMHFHQKYEIDKPYFLLVGPRLDYKNGQLLFDALSLFSAQHGYGVFCTGNDKGVAQYGRAKTGSEIYAGRLSEAELSAAYTGAVSLVFPSLYEGFGLPLIEAMACHCPVVAYPSAAAQEVAGEAALYASDPSSLCDALCEVQKPSTRRTLIRRGRDRIQRFSWQRCAQEWEEIFRRFVPEMNGDIQLKTHSDLTLPAG
ncbi:glycosyltransferase family 4 protein [bacterium]|nr:glycosyltransferase family 4 protein [bacterium]